MKQTGIELIAAERQEQLEKHQRTVALDVEENDSYQLAIAAAKMLAYPAETKDCNIPPQGWDVDLWKKMQSKSYIERLVIAGALICAELDRLYSYKNQ